MGPQIGPLRRDNDNVRDSVQGRRRYLEIINHIVTRARRQSKREARGGRRADERHKLPGSMDLSGTLINSQLLIMVPALLPFPPRPPLHLALLR